MSIDIKTEMIDNYTQLKNMARNNEEADPRLTISALKEARGYLVEINNIIRGKVDNDDMRAVAIFRVSQAVKKVGHISGTMDGDSGSSLRGRAGQRRLMGDQPVLKLSKESPEEPEKPAKSSAAYFESDYAP